MSEFDDILNEVVDDESEKYLNQASKIIALMVEQGTEKALGYNQVIAVDDTSTADTTYLQLKDGTIVKWYNNLRYSTPVGTLWADRTTATYTEEAI